MIMMLPFLTGLLAVWFGMRGQRKSCIALWAITTIVFIAWARFHITDPLGFSL